MNVVQVLGIVHRRREHASAKVRELKIQASAGNRTFLEDIALREQLIEWMTLEQAYMSLYAEISVDIRTQATKSACVRGKEK